MNTTLFNIACQKIDAENAQDPTLEVYNNKEYPKELLYSNRMLTRLLDFFPSASSFSGAKDQTLLRADFNFFLILEKVFQNLRLNR